MDDEPVSTKPGYVPVDIHWYISPDAKDFMHGLVAEAWEQGIDVRERSTDAHFYYDGQYQVRADHVDALREKATQYMRYADTRIFDEGGLHPLSVDINGHEVAQPNREPLFVTERGGDRPVGILNRSENAAPAASAREHPSRNER